MRESDPITCCKGVGGKTAEYFQKVGVERIGDLLMHLPLHYDRFAPCVPVSKLTGGTASVRAELQTEPVLRRTRGLAVLSVRAEDEEGGRIQLVWFRMPYLKNSLHKGDVKIFRGLVVRGRFGLTLQQPAIYTEEAYAGLEHTFQPVYRVTKGLSTQRIRAAAAQAFAELETPPEILPEEICRKYRLVDRYAALHEMHFPQTEESLLLARRRIVFEEFLFFILSVRSLKEERRELVSPRRIRRGSTADRLLSELPYSLTGAQERVRREILADLTGGSLMNRLVQGDVGSGKTILALAAMLDVAESGYQAALMAPTEVLARQHYENFRKLFEAHGIPFTVCLLTGSLTAAEKREAVRRIESGEAELIIGTHALIQQGVRFRDLALVVTDEQHRFGVRQRETLAEKGREPHVLVMSATPIPRTLAIILYGDLDISVVDELPGERLPIKNCVVDASWRGKAYEFIRKEVRAGHQAYIICPKVEAEEDGTGGENVTEYAETLKSLMPPGMRIAKLHGRMRPAEKNAVMEAFLRGETDVLVSTTVVEVGVDVPNATVMMIEDAERFGLATLHQLRGRVGRGGAQSYCIFVNGSGDPEKQKRLEVLNRSNDGFEIAAEDLKSRGPGDVFGLRQSGALSFSVGDIFTDSRILQEAAEAAEEIRKDPYHLERICDKINEYKKFGTERISL